MEGEQRRKIGSGRDGENTFFSFSLFTGTTLHCTDDGQYSLWVITTEAAVVKEIKKITTLKQETVREAMLVASDG